jgi:hypothetical protein
VRADAGDGRSGRDGRWTGAPRGDKATVGPKVLSRVALGQPCGAHNRRNAMHSVSQAERLQSAQSRRKTHRPGRASRRSARSEKSKDATDERHSRMLGPMVGTQHSVQAQLEAGAGEGMTRASLLSHEAQVGFSIAVAVSVLEAWPCSDSRTPHAHVSDSSR